MINKIVRKIRELFFFEQFHQIYWKGLYPDWQAAMHRARGYDDEAILERVKKAIIEVKEGRAVFERDGEVFYHTEYNYPLATFLLKVAIENNGKLRVLDFGGSLGSTWLQHRALLEKLDVKWHIVEQPHFVAAGREIFKNHPVLSFYNQIEEIPEKKDLFIVASGVLQCINNYQNILQRLIALHANYFYIDRLPLTSKSTHLLTLQFVRRNDGVEESYPSWVFSKELFLRKLNHAYRLVSEGKSLDIVAAKVKGLPGYFDNFCWLYFEKR
ncbi:MAG: methyltransferase, TIGR04325 family [Cytophagales bacterium]|nr:methyltransferase, TIGR04325 family [Cytophagales bacterium]